VTQAAQRSQIILQALALPVLGKARDVGEEGVLSQAAARTHAARDPKGRRGILQRLHGGRRYLPGNLAANDVARAGGERAKIWQCAANLSEGVRRHIDRGRYATKGAMPAAATAASNQGVDIERRIATCCHKMS